MTNKEAKVLREGVLSIVEGSVEVEGFEVAGRTSEGVAFVNEAGESFVIRTIVKAEGTDIRKLVADFEEKQRKAEEKAKEKESKAE